MALNPGYKLTLSGPDLKRYEHLMFLCDGKDPFEFIFKNGSDDEHLVPKVNIIHILQYLLNSTRPVTVNSFSKYKSTQAYKFCYAGFVKEIRFFELPDDKIVCLGRVRHSQSMNDTLLKCWCLVKKDGDVLAGWCNCMAGRSESCSHVGAILFNLEFAASEIAKTPCTSRNNMWRPPFLKEVAFKEIQNIDFTPASAKRRKHLANNADPSRNNACVPPVVLTSVSKSPANEPPVSAPVVNVHPVSIPPASRPAFKRQCIVPRETLETFFSNLQTVSPSSSIFRVLPQFCRDYAPKPLDDDLPKPLTNLFDKSWSSKTLTEIRFKCKDLAGSAKVSLFQVLKVEKETRRQSICKLWGLVKAGRVGGSSAAAICSLNPDNPAITTVKKVCYPFKQGFLNQYMKDGLLNEMKVMRLYRNRLIADGHKGVTLRKSGFVISQEYPHLGASPDAVVFCECCSGGLAEGKFLINEFDEINGNIPKAHYYQMQLQLLCVGPTFHYCDYAVLGNGKFSMRRVYPDALVQNEIIEKSSLRFLDVILPELLSKYFTLNVQPRVKRKEPEVDQDSDVPDVVSVSSSVLPTAASLQYQLLVPTGQVDDEVGVCFCGHPRQGVMIKCDGDSCMFEWFHLRCTDVPQKYHQSYLVGARKKKPWLCLGCR